jgi:hypothetical protein
VASVIAAPRSEPGSPGFEPDALTTRPTHLFDRYCGVWVGNFGQTELSVCEGGREETDRLSRVWLLMLHQATDCTARGRPVQYPVTVYRSHRANARDTAGEHLVPGCYAFVSYATPRLETGSPSFKSSALTTRPTRLETHTAVQSLHQCRVTERILSSVYVIMCFLLDFSVSELISLG